MGIAPDHVALVAGPDGVVAVTAQQHVVHAELAAHDAAFVAGVPLVMADHGPAFVVGHGRRDGAGAQQQGAGQTEEQR
jgi:hypothetical protein